MNYMAIGYESSDYELSDTHGGNSTLHKKEIEKIVNDVTDKKLSEYNDYIKELIKEEIRNAADYISNNIYSALNKDVITSVNVISDDGRTLWNDTKTRQVLYQEIYNVFRDGLKNKVFNIK